jgi:biotin synthase
LERYRLSPKEILNCCRIGNELGLKTFVLQGGEDPWFSADRFANLIKLIRSEFPEHAITISIGERPLSDYELFFQAGANRYLLRHETALDSHYAMLHPSSMTLEKRKQCLRTLKEIGYQTGAGFMVGSPFQTPEALLADIRFLEELQPQMAGIGPFIPQKDTPFNTQPSGDPDLCLKMLALTRLILPKALIPATTAMETITPNGREMALSAGANIIMPNLSPVKAKKLYTIYDKKYTGEKAPGDITLYARCDAVNDAALTLARLKEKIINSGYEPDMSRGDAL